MLKHPPLMSPLEILGKTKTLKLYIKQLVGSTHHFPDLISGLNKGSIYDILAIQNYIS